MTGFTSGAAQRNGPETLTSSTDPLHDELYRLIFAQPKNLTGGFLDIPKSPRAEDPVTVGFMRSCGGVYS